MESKDKVINMLKKMFPNRIQMFDCRDLVGDYKELLYADNNVTVLYAPYLEYVEVIGLPDEDYREVFEACGY